MAMCEWTGMMTPIARSATRVSVLPCAPATHDRLRRLEKVASEFDVLQLQNAPACEEGRTTGDHCQTCNAKDLLNSLDVDLEYIPGSLSPRNADIASYTEFHDSTSTMILEKLIGTTIPYPDWVDVQLRKPARILLPILFTRR